MPYTSRLKRTYAAVAFASWLMLVGNILLCININVSLDTNSVYSHVNNLLTVIFMFSVFLSQQNESDHIKGTDFMAYLWKLFVQAGLAAYVCVVMHVGYLVVARHWFPDSKYLLNIIYSINFALFIYFLARAFYTWKKLILFQKSKSLHTEWRWFEWLMYGSLLLTLFNISYITYIFVPLLCLLVLYIFFVSVNLRWVAYLTLTKKWRSILLLIVLLVSAVLFGRYFQVLAGNPNLVADHFEHPFVLLMLFFVFIYAFISLLVAVFSLPTSSVFEQKRDDLMNIQKLSQSIQQGQDESQVFDMLFDSTTKATGADAAWIEISDNEEDVSHMLNLDLAKISRIRQILKNLNLDHVDYINNNLELNNYFRELGLPYKSLLVVALKSSKRSFGMLYLLKDIDHGFDRESINTVRTYTNQTILTIENLRLIEDSLQNERYKEELKIASAVQDSLIPKSFPSDSWFEVSTYAQPAKEVGGDFYDFLMLSESRIAIIIGDVSGKGVSAAFHMAQMKGIFHALMQDDLDPVVFMTKANSALSRCLERTSFITSSLYIIDYKMQGLMFARAGHCHTLYYNSMTEETFYFVTEGLGLGIIRDASYAKRIHKLYYDYNPGDVMVIYTDGVTEARSPAQEEYGEDRLKDMLQQTYHLEAEDIKYAIVNDLKTFIGDAHLHDDQTLMVVKFRNVQPKIQM
ncbi:PP2C family protein-serine/threonine phosphatase [Adhaeribacter sp. BT258]|uniref:PP2C family protein-serine/threonine phosphatase n=1 Tax=Adhaeribacter terrigena TaxID=2793070 RepID=A0ABS1BYL3_9BACT|nr:PP2C family protein-serine/threonine phosphatase [Adhaeribacter terrigena]MBK0401478.1 PP2C family protein-serine/threonine phosphatase [Adhaeribacter terrigena]